MKIKAQGDHQLLFTKAIFAFDENKNHGFVLLIKVRDNNISKNLKKAISALSFIGNDF